MTTLEDVAITSVATVNGTNGNENGHHDLNKKRADYLEWAEYFMAIAFLAAKRSKDPSTQVSVLFVTVASVAINV